MHYVIQNATLGIYSYTNFEERDVEPHLPIDFSKFPRLFYAFYCAVCRPTDGVWGETYYFYLITVLGYFQSTEVNNANWYVIYPIFNNRE